MTDFLRLVLAVCGKEVRLLTRDRAGLIVLFAMPLLLALVATVVQDRAMQLLAAPQLDLLLLDEDGGEAGRILEEGLRSAGIFTVSRTLDGVPVTEEAGQRAVGLGRYQAMLRLPAGASRETRARAQGLAARLMSTERRAAPPDLQDLPRPPRPILRVDPVLPDAYRKLLRNVVGGVLQGYETRLLVEATAQEIARQAAAAIGAPLPEPVRQAMETIPAAALAMSPLADPDERVATDQPWLAMPSAAQQNIPAWTIFAMYLIVIPLAGSMIRERRDQTSLRVRMAPGGPSASLLGKALIYLGVCGTQFGVLFAAGVLVLPLVGIGGFAPGAQWPGALVVGLATALAAVAFGLLVGALAGSPEQAALFGATTVVILAAIGGVMLPLFVMPEPLKALAAWSPLGWSQRAFLDLFLRQVEIAAVMPWIGRLLAFSAIGTGLALTWSRQQA
ncbi:MAG TPA: ABC transporter permease [Myxococcota bacterium]|nr:ABC transporter permease [Myxococcota bacterium]HQK51809.1 ABC transporter permease [Myxococcota bacterium]